MLNIDTVPARKLQKSYKAIIENVKTKKHAVVLTTNDKPQAAIVSLEDFDALNRAKAKQGALDLLQLATDNKKALASLPADMREKADEMLYTR